MSLVRLVLVTVCTLALGPSLHAQSLADAADAAGRDTTKPADAKKVYRNKDLTSRPAPTVPAETVTGKTVAAAARPPDMKPIPQKDLDALELYRRRRAALDATLAGDTAMLEIALRRGAYLAHMVNGLHPSNQFREPYVDQLRALQPRIDELTRTVTADQKAVHDWDVVNR